MAENGKKENGKDSENRIVVFFKFLKKIVYNFFQEMYNFPKEVLKLLKEIILTTLSGILKILIKIIEVILRFLAGIITALAYILATLLEKSVGSIKETVKLSGPILITLILSIGGGSFVGLTVSQIDDRELKSEIVDVRNEIVNVRNEIAQMCSEEKPPSEEYKQAWEERLQGLECKLEAHDKESKKIAFKLNKKLEQHDEESKKIECKLQEELEKHNKASEDWQKCVDEGLKNKCPGGFPKCHYDKPGTYECPDTQNSETKQAENTDSAP